MTSMAKTRSFVVGGFGDDSDLGIWRASLFKNPAVATYLLGRISELVDDAAKKAAVDARIDTVCSTTLPDDKADILAMYVPLTKYVDDYGSGQKLDITVAYPSAPDGWLRLCQYAQPANWANTFNPPGMGLVVKANPNKAGNTAPGYVVPVKAAEGADCVLNLRGSYFVWKARTRDNNRDYLPWGCSKCLS